jgi:hypothetical protein
MRMPDIVERGIKLRRPEKRHLRKSGWLPAI